MTARDALRRSPGGPLRRQLREPRALRSSTWALRSSTRALRSSTWTLRRSTWALRSSSAPQLLCALLLCAPLVGCASTPSSVDRAENGKVWRDRYIDALSYAWYVRGAQLEARGQLQEAEAAYFEAAQRDPESGSLWARIGAMRCQQGSTGASAAFKRAWDTQNDRTTVLVERGRCALRGGRFAEALKDGRSAVAISPRSVDANLLVVDALLGLDREEEALRWLDALAAFLPTAQQVQTRRIFEARRRGDTSRERRARELRVAQLSAQTLEPQADDPELEVTGPSAIDADLALGNGDRALERATRLGLGPAELALRAIGLGRPELGQELAQLALDADPDSADARIALLVAQDLLATNEDSSSSTSDLSLPRGASNDPDELRSARALSPLAVLLFGELLERRAGLEARELWHAAHPVPPSEDRLVERVRRRATPLETAAGSNEP